MQTIQPATLAYAQNGTPYSEQYDDVYHTSSGALAQAQHVFLAGNTLPQRWANKKLFVIIETGFGLGHNFLATWQAWQEDPQRCQRLHFTSVEKHPFNAHDMATAHASASVPTTLSQQLIEHWPALLPGFHRLELEGGRIILTLLFGDAAALLNECVAQANAIYLDGFSPSKNPDIWSLNVFQTLAKRCAPDCTLATWSVSGAVRRSLTEAGFSVQKETGFGTKRNMLTGSFYAPNMHKKHPPQNNHAIIIGAGLAGTAIAERLATRGWHISLLESQSSIAQGASGNLAGAFRPHPSLDDNRLARLTRAGFIYALQHLQRLEQTGHPVRWNACGVLHLARDTQQENKLRETVSALSAPTDYLQFFEQEQASRIAGQNTAHGGWWFPQGGWIAPPSLCAANLASQSERITLQCNAYVNRITYNHQKWEVYNTQDSLLAQAPVLILANAHDAYRLAGAHWLPLCAARGQVSLIPEQSITPLNTVVCGSGYVTPVVDGFSAMGATFMVNDLSLDLREEEHQENINMLEKMLPDYGKNLSIRTLKGRVGLRPITPDRLPMVGSISETPGLWLFSGFGARGLVWGNLCAELLASQICDEPLPLENELVKGLAPSRFKKDQK